MNTQALARLAVLQERKKSLKGSLSSLNDEITKLQEDLIPQLQEEGVKRMTVQTGLDESGNPVHRTVYMARTLWASHQGDALALASAMTSAGLVEYVKPTVNLKQLSAYVREFDPDKNLSPDEIIAKLPQELKDVIKVSEVYELKSTAA